MIGNDTKALGVLANYQIISYPLQGEQLPKLKEVGLQKKELRNNKKIIATESTWYENTFIAFFILSITAAFVGTAGVFFAPLFWALIPIGVILYTLLWVLCLNVGDHFAT